MVAGRNTALVVLAVSFLIYLFDNKGIIYQVSKVKIFNYLGLTSYSFYLFHQPIFAFYRYIFEKPITINILFILFLINFLLSIYSYKFVENYYRFKMKYNFKIMLTHSIIFITLFFSIFFVSKNFFKLPPNVYYESLGEKIICSISGLV